ncbi:MAG: hypothetical protein HY343_12960 [Lentisphaerae bacterium]|nr:hypothetical protein [Lentisphaerota bacterium]
MSQPPHARSLRDVRGAGQARLYSIPKQQRSVHLDLYVLAREKDRLEKELFQVQAKGKLIAKRLAQSHKRMNGLLREISRLQPGDRKHGPAATCPAKPDERSRKGTVKKIRLEY